MKARDAITGETVEDALAVEGQAKDGMSKVVIDREAKAACGCAITKEMGVKTWAVLAGSDEKAVVDGDFAMLETERQGVLNGLRKDIDIVAIHHHLAGETPRYLFLHYWGRGPWTR